MLSLVALQGHTNASCYGFGSFCKYGIELVADNLGYQQKLLDLAPSMRLGKGTDDGYGLAYLSRDGKS